MELIKVAIKNLLGIFGLNIYKSNKKDIEDFIKKIFVHDLGYNLIRVGSNGDGGYLVPNILKQISYCFSPGVGGIVHFENDLQKRGIKCFLADCTVQDPSNKIEKYDFIKKNINVFNDSNNITLESWISQKLKENKKKEFKDFIIYYKNYSEFKKIMNKIINRKISYKTCFNNYNYRNHFLRISNDLKLN